MQITHYDAKLTSLIISKLSHYDANVNDQIFALLTKFNLPTVISHSDSIVIVGSAHFTDTHFVNTTFIENQFIDMSISPTLTAVFINSGTPKNFLVSRNLF